jgi:4-amino-4-deoxy-L-arabinose transferase-like glycosyltransferase
MIAIIALAFISRVASLFLLGRHLKPELWEYNTIALNIIHNKTYVIKWLNTDYRSFGYPLYPMLSATFHFLTKENYFVLGMFQLMLSVLSCYLLYLITKRIFDSVTAVISFFLLAIHPGLIVYSTKMHELTLVVFLAVLTFLLMISLDRRRLRNNIFLGLAIGIGTLTRPLLIFFLPVYFIYITFLYAPFKNRPKTIFVVFLAVILVILPWTIRNYMIHKRWIFITTNSAEHFWRGNNPFSSGTASLPDSRGIIEAAPRDFLDRLYKMNEIEQYDYFYKETFKFIKANPPFFIKMFFRKLFYFWWFSPTQGLNYPKEWFVIYKSYYIFIVVCALLGLFAALKENSGSKRRISCTIILFFLIVSIAHALYYVDGRHRWTVEPFMLIFTANGISFVLSKLNKFYDIKLCGGGR